MNTLYPELEDYIYEYCQSFQTETELLASKTALYTGSTSSEQMHARMLKQGWISDAPAVVALLADGHAMFKKRVVQRIWQEHWHELPLNLCPKCNKITRTPQAQQCRFCYHSWHPKQG